jgi:hypothetical protein
VNLKVAGSSSLEDTDFCIPPPTRMSEVIRTSQKRDTEFVNAKQHKDTRWSENKPL